MTPRPGLRAVPTTPGAVVDGARVESTVRMVAQAVIAVGAIVGLDLVGLEDQAVAIAQAVVAAIAGVAVIVDFILTRWRAWRTRDYVTPVDDPHDHDGRRLVPERTAA